MNALLVAQGLHSVLIKGINHFATMRSFIKV